MSKEVSLQTFPKVHKYTHPMDEPYQEWKEDFEAKLREDLERIRKGQCGHSLESYIRKEILKE